MFNIFFKSILTEINSWTNYINYVYTCQQDRLYPVILHSALNEKSYKF